MKTALGDPEMVANLVDDGYAHLLDDFFPGRTTTLDRTAEDRDAIGEMA